MPNEDPTIQLFDIFEKETERLVMTIEAASFEEAADRLRLTTAVVQQMRCHGLAVLRQRHPDQPISSPYFKDGFFKLLAQSQATLH